MIYIQQQIENWLTSNIIQTYPDYNPATTYIKEDITTPSNSSVVRYDGYYWRSLTNANIGNDPEETEGVYWNKWKVSNTYAMLDQKSLTKTTDIGDDIVVEFVRNQIDSLGLGYLETSSIKIEHFDELGAIIDSATQEINFSVNEEVYDLWSYMYAPYSEKIDRGIYFPIPPIGYKVKVTIGQLGSTGQAACGFLIAGEGVDMGETLDEVGFNFNSFASAETDAFGNLNIIRRDVQDLVDFETAIDRAENPRVRRRIKGIYDEIVLFVIDPSSDSDFENMITLGKIQDASTVGRVMSKNIISWSVMESI